jgi:hypothetical protein
MTREEQYLAKIAGKGTEIPSEPRLRSEQYLAKIAGEDVGIPQKPLHNEETYLAILAGEDYEIPAPYNRIEQYMAKACGAEIEVPTPITRVEQLWAQIAEGGSWTVTEITGTLPLTFLSKGDDLIDYRIHGTSEGVGERTAQLLDGSTIQKGIIYNGVPSYEQDTVSASFENGTITFTTQKSGYRGVYFDFIEIDDEYTVSIKNAVSNGIAYLLIDYYDKDKTYISRQSNTVPNSYPHQKSYTPPASAKYVRVSIQNNEIGTMSVEQLMLVRGSTAPNHYIPPGYKLPLTVESGAQSQDIPIYIGSTKLGAKEYVDYGEQKIYKMSEGTLVPTNLPVPLPLIQTYKGENTLSSTETLGEVTVKGMIKEAGDE